MADQFVVFRVGSETYAVSIRHVQEIVGWERPTPLPGGQERVEGVVNLRGRVIPVVDLGKRFGTGRYRPDADASVMVIEYDQDPAGLMVDEVTEVLTLAPAQIQPPAPIAVNPRDPIVTGIAQANGRLIILVDLARIVGEAALAELHPA